MFNYAKLQISYILFFPEFFSLVCILSLLLIKLAHYNKISYISGFVSALSIRKFFFNSVLLLSYACSIGCLAFQDERFFFFLILVFFFVGSVFF